jgi:hypothetical protein
MTKHDKTIKIGWLLIGLFVFGVGWSNEANLGLAENRWLLLLYDDADFGGFDPIVDFAAEAYSHENLDVLILEDNHNSPAMIWQVGPRHELTPRKYLGEIDMSSPASLEYFLKYAHNRFPNRRTILCFYDHGAGWWGACLDETSRKTEAGAFSLAMLTPWEMRTALEKTMPVDLICFTAPCLMGSLEAAYELRQNYEAWVGSENFSGYIYWYGCIGFVCDMLKNRPGLGAQELAQEILNFTATNFSKYNAFEKNYTMAAVRGDRLAEAVEAVRELSTSLLANWGEAFSLLDQALTETLTFGDTFADVIGLFEEMMERCQNPALKESLRRAAETVRQTLIAEAHGREMSGANGLNIYFPLPFLEQLDPVYGGPDLAFTRDTAWFEVLNAYRISKSFGLEPTGCFRISRGDGFYPPPDIDRLRGGHIRKKGGRP